MSSKHIKLFTWIYLLVLVLGSVLPINSGTTLNDNYLVEVRSDYLIHFLILLPLPLMLSLSLSANTGLWIRVTLLGMLIVVFCEGIQWFIPYRTFNINDLLANGIGALIGVIPAIFVWRRFSHSGR
jgi:VanZ family protein